MKPGPTFFRASFGALLGVVAIAVATVMLGHDDFRVAGLIGGGRGIAGLTIACVVVIATIDTIVLPILSFAFVGAGVVAGARHDSTRSPPPADVSPNEES